VKLSNTNPVAEKSKLQARLGEGVDPESEHLEIAMDNLRPASG
jgi:hypothetical protein